MKSKGTDGLVEMMKRILQQGRRIGDLLDNAVEAIGKLNEINQRNTFSLLDTGEMRQINRNKREDFEDAINELLAQAFDEITSLQESITSDTSSKQSVIFLVNLVDYFVEEHQRVSQELSQIQIQHTKQVVFSKTNLSKLPSTAINTDINTIQVHFDSKNKISYETDDTDEEFDDKLDVDLRMELELENSVLKSQLDSYLSATQQAEQQIQQISELLSLFNSKLVEQREVITQITEEASTSNLNIERGNEQLKKTDDRATNDIQLFLAYIFAAILLLIYDW